MAVYDSLPPEATSGRKKAKTPRQIRDEELTPRKMRAKVYKKGSSELSELAENKTKGFENNAKKIARDQGISIERARAILAAGARKASPAAKRANPALKKVKGVTKKK